MWHILLEDNFDATRLIDDANAEQGGHKRCSDTNVEQCGRIGCNAEHC